MESNSPLFLETTPVTRRAETRLAPSQWETSLQSNAVSHWLGANLDITFTTKDVTPVYNLLAIHLGTSKHVKHREARAMYACLENYWKSKKHINSKFFSFCLYLW